MKKELKIISISEIETREVNWLWYPFIPYGKITIVQGDPGEGKTTFALQLAALLSNGTELPCTDNKTEEINIIYQTAEDGYEDTIKPRLVSAGADCKKIMFIDESVDPLSMSDERLEKAIAETGARLIILDPIQAYIGSNVDMHRANEIRPVLNRLSVIAENYNCAIILIGHMNKAKGKKSTYRGLGSIDFQATARSVLIIGRLKDNPRVRVIAHEKSSLAPEGTSIAFELSEENGFKWLGYYDISVDVLLSGSTSESKQQMAEDLIADMLEDGEVSQKEIWSKAAAMGISKRVLDQAKKNLEVKSNRRSNAWYWNLAEH
ncbi:MAG: AAA family ATPase [Clostridiales bacterium]|nr:AAA family ATPase [Clostridiales bacterium]